MFCIFCLSVSSGKRFSLLISERFCLIWCRVYTTLGLEDFSSDDKFKSSLLRKNDLLRDLKNIVLESRQDSVCCDSAFRVDWISRNCENEGFFIPYTTLGLEDENFLFG